VTEAPRIENGEMLLPTGPGWGAQINEEVLAAHPWQPTDNSVGY
jgi:galactonate dehydratase